MCMNIDIRLLKGKLRSKEQSRYRAIRQLSKNDVIVVDENVNIIINWLNFLTDTSDTVYDGITPTITSIESEVDIINGEII